MITFESDMSDAMIFEKFPDRPIRQQLIEGVTLEKTLHHMKKFIRAGRKDAKLVYLTRYIVRDCPGRDFDCIARKVYAWLIRKIKYVRDPDKVEWLQDHEVTLRNKTGDCDDFTILGAAMLGAMGLTTRIKIAQANVPMWNHVYLEYFSPTKDEWIAFDASNKKHVGWEYPKILRTKTYEVN